MKNARKSPWRLLYKFHRYCGLVSAIILMMLAITGIGLNHTDDLQLDSRYIASPKILDWYGIQAPTDTVTFKTKHHWLTQIYDQIYLDQQQVFKQPEKLIGVVDVDTYMVLAFSDVLVLISPTGEIIEKIQKQVKKLGKNQLGYVFIDNEKGIYYTDDDLLTWQLVDRPVSEWSQQTLLINPDYQQLVDQYRANIIPYERVLLDIHSGRFFGSYGVLIIDLFGVMLLLLTLSGCWMWCRHKIKQLLAKKRTRNKFSN